MRQMTNSQGYRSPSTAHRLVKLCDLAVVLCYVRSLMVVRPEEMAFSTMSLAASGVHMNIQS